MQEWVKKTICGCSFFTTLDLSDCLTHTAGEGKAFLRMKTIRTDGSDETSLQNHTHISPLGSLLLFMITRGWKNKYLQWAVRHCWNFCRDVWYVNIYFYRNFNMKARTWREHLTWVHHYCSLSHNVGKARDSSCTDETLRWGLVSDHTDRVQCAKSGTHNLGRKLPIGLNENNDEIKAIGNEMVKTGRSGHYSFTRWVLLGVGGERGGCESGFMRRYDEGEGWEVEESEWSCMSPAQTESGPASPQTSDNRRHQGQCQTAALPGPWSREEALL